MNEWSSASIPLIRPHGVNSYTLSLTLQVYVKNFRVYLKVSKVITFRNSAFLMLEFCNLFLGVNVSDCLTL